jgi:alpha-galactosidase/6-phospho-beta-glucosidase family protein
MNSREALDPVLGRYNFRRFLAKKYGLAHNEKARNHKSALNGLMFNRNTKVNKELYSILVQNWLSEKRVPPELKNKFDPESIKRIDVFETILPIPKKRWLVAKESLNRLWKNTKNQFSPAAESSRRYKKSASKKRRSKRKYKKSRY